MVALTRVCVRARAQAPLVLTLHGQLSLLHVHWHLTDVIARVEGLDTKRRTYRQFGDVRFYHFTGTQKVRRIV